MEEGAVLKDEDFQKCVEFHGHICPGLAIGFRAAKAGLEQLKATRSEDEELVAIVENNACGTDAVQVLTGCTFGKGNFFHKDYGKHAFTFIGRTTGKGVRVVLKPDVMKPNEQHRNLMEKIRQETATEEEKKMFWDLHQQRCKNILEKPVDELFSIKEATSSLPPKAKIEVSVVCERCGEAAMASKLQDVAGQKICMGCAAAS